ncbi:MAG: molybdenum ABC transporter ATP-binding protein [Pyrinomonadaceae bacterium]|nr:molybdenum ABC transporter ATP-binding protein [Pyrinomonadaceae bacterium]
MSLFANLKIRKDSFHLGAEFEARRGMVTGLFGSSGIGKTSILRALAGLDRHTGSIVSIDDDVLQDGSRFLAPHERRIGYVFQDANLFWHHSVKGNLKYAANRAAKPMPIDEVAEKLGISKLMERDTESLSGGERQRVAIARAIIGRPRLLLMDEPLASLDRESKNEILPVIESVVSETQVPVVYVSHDLEEIARLADNLVLLGDGEVLATGPVKEILTRLDLPASLGPDAEALITASVENHEDQFGLTELVFDGGTVIVPMQDLEIGSQVKLRVFARDVSITLERQRRTSIQNVFPATVREIAFVNESQAVVSLTAGSETILSRITRKSVSDLGLDEGLEVFAQVKSVVLIS